MNTEKKKFFRYRYPCGIGQISVSVSVSQKISVSVSVLAFFPVSVSVSVYRNITALKSLREDKRNNMPEIVSRPTVKAPLPLLMNPINFPPLSSASPNSFAAPYNANHRSAAPYSQANRAVPMISSDSPDSAELLRRSYNVVIAGLEEPEGMSPEKSDVCDVKMLFDYLNAPISIHHCAIMRIGPPMPGKSRLIRVTLPDLALCQLLLSRCHRLKSSPDFSTVYVNPDRTRSQQLAHRQMLSERLAKKNGSSPLSSFIVPSQEFVPLPTSVPSPTQDASPVPSSVPVPTQDGQPPKN